MNLSRDKTNDTSISDANKSSSDVFNTECFRQISSKIKVHVFNPKEIITETEKNIYIIPANKRKTSQVITDFEYTRILSERAQEIQNGSPIFVNIGDKYMDEIEIAKLEIRLKKCPLMIKRMYNETIAELWEVNEMDIPYLDQ